MSLVLGVSMSSHDRAAALLEDGKVIGAVAEERLDRRKRSEGLVPGQRLTDVLPPLRSITSLLRDRGATLNDLDLVVCGRSIASARDSLLSQLPIDPGRVVEPPMPAHHLAHAYSAYGTSPFNDPAVLVVDEQGSHVAGRHERISWFVAEDGRLNPLASFMGDQGQLSLGMLFDIVSALVGLSEARLPAAGKLMALAAFADTPPSWPDPLTTDESGDVFIGIDVLDRHLVATGLPIRPDWQPRGLIDSEDFRLKFVPIHWDTRQAKALASWAQEALMRGVAHTAAALRRRVGSDELAYAGGVALNCAATSSLRSSGWRDVFVHPAATDDGCAVGLAFYGWIEELGNRRPPVGEPFSPCLGPLTPPASAQNAIEEAGLTPHAHATSAGDIAAALHEGAIVCRAAGRSEWGPRALGNRSILVDPTREGVVAWVNARVKFREAFRPFGVCVLSDAADEMLVLDSVPKSLGPYMVAVAPVRGTALAHLAHADGTIRYQLVDEVHQPQIADILRQFAELSGVPAVLNTSFNTMGEPLVESCHDAVRQFVQSGADVLVLDDLTVDLRSLGASEFEGLRTALGSGIRDPFQAALSIEAAGYPEQAWRMFQRLSAEDGLPTSGFHVDAFRMRAAERNGETVIATEMAERIVQQASWPNAAHEALRALSSNSDYDSQRVALLRRVATGRGALELAKAINPSSDSTDSVDDILRD